MSTTETEITLIVEPFFLFRWFGAKEKERKFVGSGTVWYELPDFRRPGSHIEGRLSEIRTKMEYYSEGLEEKGD